MVAHRADSRAMSARGSSADASEGVTAFLEKRDAAFPDRVSDGLPDVSRTTRSPGSADGALRNLDVVGAADRLAGDAVEHLMNAHHARRLARLGHAEQREPPDDGRLWTAGDPPPRAGNALEVLIGGAAYFAAVERAIRAARRSVLIAGWSLSPHFALVRDEPPVLLRELLAEAAEALDVRVLLWAGAPVPLFAPRRSAVREARDKLVRGTRIRAALDSKERPLHCHHEKLVLVDDDVAFVGGIDLTDLAGDRWDTPPHPARGRLGWHDVASRIRGPGGRGRPRSLRAALALPSPATRSSCRRSSRSPPGRWSCRSCAPSPRSSTTSRRAATSGSSRPTCARCAPPGGSSTSRTSSSGRRRS